MRLSRNSIIYTSSAFALALGLATPAAAQQDNTVTQNEAEQCAKLPTDQERQACVEGQKTQEGSPEQAGELGTIPATETAEKQAETDTIVVTGSRIKKSPFSSPDPISVVDPALEQKGGKLDTAEILQGSPVAAGSFQITSLLSAGSFVTNGGVGAQTLSLRGLGPERTLVLVNGRRAGPAGTRGSIAGFDLNVIPSSLIQSAEVLKTGASSIYGSDAIAGVVNLLTKKSTDGVEVRGFVSAPFEGGAENYNVNFAYGKEFSRGHIIAGVDFFKRTDLTRGDRDYLTCSNEYLFSTSGARLEVNDPRTGEPRCNGTQANYIGLSSSVTSTGRPGVTFSTVQFNNPGDRLNEFLPVQTNTASFALPAGYFGIPTSCTATAAANPANVELCRNALGLVNQHDPLQDRIDVFPELKRYTIFADAGFDITDNIELVGEFLFNNRKTESDGLRQLFFNQFSGSTTLAASQCTAIVRVTRPNCVPTGTGDPLNAGFNGNVLLTPVIPLATFVGTDVDYYRGVAGLKGDLGGMFGGGFFDGWGFDSYVQYSKNVGRYTNSRVFQDAIDTQQLRTRLCQPGQVTRLRGVPCLNIDFTDPRVLSGQFTQQESDYLFGEETGKTKYDQITAEASVNGNLFRLPAGPVGVALGVQWRRDEIDDTPGDIALTANPNFNSAITPGSPACNASINPLQVCDPFVSNVFGQSVSGRTAGFTRSQEAFGEIEVPVFKNVPFIQELTLSGAARIVNGYAERNDGENDKDKNNWTYKLGANWQVNDWLRFRATQGTSFRFPALFEQFLANQTGFQNQSAIDPCIRYGTNVEAGVLSARIGERCAALGLPADYAGLHSSAIVSTGGGVGVLDPETSKARTFSVIVTPPVGLWEGMRFSVAVDYFDIKVKNQVTTLGASNIIFSCLDSDNYPDDALCALFDRETNPTATNFGQITSVRNPFLNINEERNRGVDVTARITQDLGNLGKLSALGQMTWQIEDLFKLFAGSVSDSEGTVGEPTFVGDYKLTWDKGPWSVFYGLNVIGGTSDEQNLRDARAGDVCFSSPIRGGLICPVYKLDAQFYHNASVTREIGDRFSLTFGVNNLFDTNPPRVSGSFGPISTIGQAPVFGTQYDLIGRRAFLSARAKF